jgi:hypothetical protein
MIDAALTAGIPLVCSLPATLILATRAWQPGYARAERRRHRGGKRLR